MLLTRICVNDIILNSTLNVAVCLRHQITHILHKVTLQMINNEKNNSNNKSGMFKQKVRRFFMNLRQDANILLELTRKSVKTQYRGSILGMFWTVLHPLLNMGVMWLVFSQFFGRDDPAYPIYLLTGNILFTSLRAATDGALGSVVANRGLLLRTKISSHLFPMASVTSALVSLGFSFIALLLIMIGTQIWGGLQLFGVQMLLVLAMLPALLMFEIGIGLALSAIYVYGRDIKHFYSVFLTLWMYLTPISYKPSTMLDANLAKTFAFKVVECNPMYYFVQYFRDAVYYNHYTGQSIWQFTNKTGSAWLAPAMLTDVPMLLWLYFIGIISCALGWGLFAILKRRFATHL